MNIYCTEWNILQVYTILQIFTNVIADTNRKSLQIGEQEIRAEFLNRGLETSQKDVVPILYMAKEKPIWPPREAIAITCIARKQTLK